jgi:hypothetical protein
MAERKNIAALFAGWAAVAASSYYGWSWSEGVLQHHSLEAGLAFGDFFPLIASVLLALSALGLGWLVISLRSYLPGLLLTFAAVFLPLLCGIWPFAAKMLQSFGQSS